MNCILCNIESLCSVDSLFNCFQNSHSFADINTSDKHDLQLIIDRDVKKYNFALDKSNTRMIMTTLDLYLINNIHKNPKLPPLFKTLNTKGKKLDDVLHPQMVPFYRNVILSTIQEKTVVRLHIILNKIHILLSCIPVFDNNNTIVAITLLETPYTNIEQLFNDSG